MITDQDIQKLKEAFATKDDLQNVRNDMNEMKSELKGDVQDVRNDIEGLRETVQSLAVSVDNLTRSVDDLRTEYAAVLTKVDRHERWHKQVAENVGVTLEA